MKVHFENENVGVLATWCVWKAIRIVEEHSGDMDPGVREELALLTSDLLRAIDTVEELEALELADDLEDRRKEAS